MNEFGLRPSCPCRTEFRRAENVPVPTLPRMKSYGKRVRPVWQSVAADSRVELCSGRGPPGPLIRRVPGPLTGRGHSNPADNLCCVLCAGIHPIWPIFTTLPAHLQLVDG